MRASVPIAPLLKDAGAAALLAAVLFIPIIGIVLDRYTIAFQLQRGAIAVGAVFLGRLLIGYGTQAGWFAHAGAVTQPLRSGIEGTINRIVARSTLFTV